jgi:hypothetical protein
MGDATLWLIPLISCGDCCGNLDRGCGVLLLASAAHSLVYGRCDVKLEVSVWADRGATVAPIKNGVPIKAELTLMRN